MNITVIIPTYKRPRTLFQALQSLQKQTYPCFEILVMDNDVDPEIKRSIFIFNQTARIQVRYIPEPRLGVHYARNTGAQMAMGELLLYTDDDMSFDAGWVATYDEAFAAHPEMDAAGGPVLPIWEEPPPPWLLEYIGNAKNFYLLSLMQPYDSFQINGKGYFFSCNMAIRKTVLKAREGFHPEATGEIWLGDGESGLNRVMWSKGDLIGYVPRALAYHHIPSSRMTIEYLCKRVANEGASLEYTYFHEGTLDVPHLLARLVRICISLGILWVRVARQIVRRDRFIWINAQMDIRNRLARLRYVARLFRDSKFREMVTKRDWLNSR
jgi:glycosyltransferase involved in cell wall biosynthesis